MNSYEYWKKREQANSRRNRRKADSVARDVKKIRRNMQRDIEQQIHAFYGKYALEEGITLAEARKRARQLDIDAYAAKAAKYVATHDMSPQANEEMKLYNMTMKVNRLELLKAEIGLEMIRAEDETQYQIEKALRERAMQEYDRQAGILGNTLGDNTKKSERIAQASFHNAKWTDRAWTNHDELKRQLDTLLQQGMIQGRNPRELARTLQKAFKADQYKCERLMRTELARVQSDVQLDSFKQNGFTQYMYVACGYGDVCATCKAVDGGVYDIEGATPADPEHPIPPMHPNCHCSIAAYEDSNDYEGWLNYLDQGGKTEDWDAMDEADKAKYLPNKTKTQPKPKSQPKPKKVNSQATKPKVKERTILEEYLEHGNPESPIGKGYGKDYDKVISKVRNCKDAKLQEIWRQNENSIGCEADYKGHAHCDLSHKIHLLAENDLKTLSWSMENKTLFHESGHAIDMINRSKGSGSTGWAYGISGTHKDGIFAKTIVDEVNEMVDNRYKQLKKEFKLHKTDTQWLRDNGFIGSWEWRMHTEYGHQLSTPKLTKNRAYKSIEKEIKGLGEEYYNDISDMLEGATKCKISCGIGHGQSYWGDNSKRDRMLATEAFAEMFSAEMIDGKSISTIKKYLPKSYSIFREMIDILARGE